MTNQTVLVLLLCFLFLHVGGIACSSKTEKEALLSFKSRVSDPNNALGGWVAHSNHCTWYGVTCSQIGSRVQSVNLTGLCLSGMLPSHLSNLTYLHSLDLSTNNLSGTIPPEFGQLKHLQNLELSVNNLTGKVPTALANLSSLKQLALERNNLVGEIPSEIGNLRNLSFLELSQNHFSGEFPSCIFNISSLVALSVTGNNLSGKLPHYLGRSLPNLRFLTLAKNSFEGIIPHSISNASQLEQVDLSNNKFHGYIPRFNNLKNLTHLILGNNALSSTTSLNFHFFDSLRSSTKLKVLMIFGNHLAGKLPSSLANLSSSLQQFCVADNRLTGSIPRGMDKFQDVESLSFENNYFTGELPPEIGSLKRLAQIWIFNNALSGEIPDIFGNLTNLFSIEMAQNQFSGRIPSSIGQCKRLNNLYLETNRLGGTIPKEIFELPGLIRLFVGGNLLHGSIPSEISSMKQLEIMDVSNNQLSGSIPTEIDHCSGLKTLVMARNKFGGSIPSSLGNLASLETLDLSSNNLTGPIPQSLEKLSYMVALNLSFNHLEGQVPMKGVFTNLSQVDLHGNDKLCSLNMETLQKLGVILCHEGKKKRHIVLPIVLAITGATALLISMLSLLGMKMFRKKKINKEGDTSFSPAPLTGLPQNLSYSDIRLATSNFADENLIGKGGFGSVYKGVFILSTGETTTLAVKVLDLQLSKATRSFNAECEALRNVRHRNLVKVITACSSVDHKGEDFKALVMQFMVNGNLDMWLYSTDNDESGSSLTLVQRLNIAIDVASAMDYLHHDCDPPVVHCDLKPVNVLLDEDMVAHVGDFGLARLLSQNPLEKESTTLGLKGSIGYIAPEYGVGGKASTSGDVYSFGILLLEMFMGKRPTDEMFIEGLSLDKFASVMDGANQVLNVADQSLIDYNEYSSRIPSTDHKSHGSSGYTCDNGNMNWTRKAEECIAAVIRLGLSCTTQEPKDRLTMREATTKLRGIRKPMLGY